MNKNIMLVGLGLGGAALAYLAYRYMQTPSQSYSTTSLNPNSNPQYSSELTYPFSAPVPARVDNSNQPWANNNREAIAKVSSPQVNVNLSNVEMTADFLKSATSIGNSLTSIWEDFGVSDWFSSGDDSTFSADMNYDAASDWFSGGSTTSDFGSYA